MQFYLLQILQEDIAFGLPGEEGIATIQSSQPNDTHRVKLNFRQKLTAMRRFYDTLLNFRQVVAADGFRFPQGPPEMGKPAQDI